MNMDHLNMGHSRSGGLRVSGGRCLVLTNLSRPGLGAGQRFFRNAEGGWKGVFLLGFLLSLVMAVNLAFFLNDAKTTATWGAIAGFLAGFGWVAMGMAIVALFERRSWKYSLINGGYLTVALTLMGLIIGGWRK